MLALAGFMALCLLASVVDGVAARHTLRVIPPSRSWLVPTGTSIVCASLALAAWLIWQEAGVARRRHYAALRLWGWQLLAGAAWAPLLFTAHLRLAALAVLVVGGGLSLLCACRFARISPAAGALMAPNVVWLVAAGVLTIG